MKKLLLTSLLIIFTTSGVWAEPALILGSSTVYWEIKSNNTLCITGTGDMPDIGDYITQPWGASRLSITRLEIADGITAIGRYAFAGFGNLRGTLVISDNVRSIDGFAFYNCTDLEELVLGSAVENIGDNAFAGCTGLKGVFFIPDKVKVIGINAFRRCANLEYIAIGSAVETIGNYAFCDCHGLKNIKVLPVTPPVVNENAFDGNPAWVPNCKLYVPAGSEEAYKTAAGWSLFAQNTYAGTPSATVSDINVSVENGAIIITGAIQPQVSVFDMQGRIIFAGATNYIEIPQAGVYIVKVGGESVKVVI